MIFARVATASRLRVLQLGEHRDCGDGRGLLIHAAEHNGV